MTDFVRVPPSSIYTPLQPAHWGAAIQTEADKQRSEQLAAKIREEQRIEQAAHASAVTRLRAFADDDPDLLERLNTFISAYERNPYDDPDD